MSQTLFRVKISIVAIKDGLVAVANFQGEPIWKNTSFSPNGKLLSSLGDNSECLAEAQSCKVLMFEDISFEDLYEQYKVDYRLLLFAKTFRQNSFYNTC